MMAWNRKSIRMAIPQVVIVGRPNVGKSSLFNWLAGQRLAIVDDIAGVTRDRVTAVVAFGDRYAEIVDTGGIGHEDADNLTKEINQQIQTAIDEAAIVLVVVDARCGPTPMDHEIARRIRRLGKPTLLVANKADDPRREADAAEFTTWGFGEPICTSTKSGRGRVPLVAAIERLLESQPRPAERAPAPEMKLAVVGRRNVGKSTLINALCKAPRMIVSEVAGTTRDSVDVRFELDGKSFVAIDTPGLRRTRSVRTDVDFYGKRRAERSIRRADVVLMMFDASTDISHVDHQLCQYIGAQFKPCVLVVNKWDRVADKASTEDWAEYLRKTYPQLKFAPIAFITATTGRNVKRLVNHAQMLFRQSLRRVSTSQLNRLVREAVDSNPPPASGARRPKILFATQIGTAPPTIVLKCTDSSALSSGYMRYVDSAIRDVVPFGEVPIRWILEARHADETPPPTRQRSTKGR